MIKEYPQRPAADSLAERQYLERRLGEIERSMGVIAARLGTPTPIAQELDVLDRARELVGDLLKEVHVLTLDEAIAARLAWLDRVEALQGRESDEPTPALNRVPIDRRLFQDIELGWRGRRQ